MKQRFKKRFISIFAALILGVLLIPTSADAVVKLGGGTTSTVKGGTAKHTHSYKVTNTVNSTCTADGYKFYKCSGCSSTRKDVLKKKGHAYNVTSTVNATCTADGYKSYKCSRCSATTKNVLSKTGHDYIVKNTVAATCTEDGYCTSKCLTCGEFRKDVLYSTGHDFEVIDSKEATCTEEGYRVAECVNCGLVRKSEIPINGHDYVYDIKEPTCTEVGYEYKKCMKCGDESSLVLKPVGHKYEVIEKEISTESTPGYAKYQCRVCGENKKMTLEKGKPEYRYKGVLEIETLGVYVSTYSLSEDGRTAQDIVDADDSAYVEPHGFFTSIGDHDYEGFLVIKYAVPNETIASYAGKEYVCISNFEGKVIENTSGNNSLFTTEGIDVGTMEGDLMLYTCQPWPLNDLGYRYVTIWKEIPSD